MLTKRLIACLDIVNGVVTKATKFQNNLPVAPAVDVIRNLYLQGVDEVIFFDILASASATTDSMVPSRRSFRR